MSDFNEVLEGGCDTLQWTSAQMKELAQAFSLTGNETIARKLATLAYNVACVSTEIRTAYGTQLNETFQESQRVVGRIFADLAG